MANLRPADEVRGVALRMGVDYVEELDDLCLENNCSRRQIVEKLVRQEYKKLLRRQQNKE